jgi:phytoene dehydrogenase-like protein
VAQILVLGAGMCGLSTALLLARDGHTVTVLET